MSSLPMGTQYATVEHTWTDGIRQRVGSVQLAAWATVRQVGTGEGALVIAEMHIPAVVATTASVSGSRRVRYHLGKMLYLMPSLSNTYAAAVSKASGSSSERACAPLSELAS